MRSGSLYHTCHRQQFAGHGFIGVAAIIALLCRATGVIDVMARYEGDWIMTTNIDRQAKAEGTAPAKGNKKASVAQQARRCCARQGEVGEEANPAKKAAQGARAGKRAKAAAGAREGSKTEKVLELLKCPDGATAKELMKSDGLAEPFRSRVPVRHRKQEDGADGHVHWAFMMRPVRQ